MKLRFPIAWKLIVVTVLILLAATISIAINTSEMFKDVSGRREEDFNRSIAQAIASQVDSKVRANIQKSTVYGGMVLSSIKSERNTGPDIARWTGKSGRSFIVAASQDPELISLSLYRRKGKKTFMVGRYTNNRFLDQYSLNQTYLSRLNKKKPFPSAAVFGGNPLMRNRSIPGGAPILSLGVPLLKDSRGVVEYIVVADFDLAVIQKPFLEDSIRNIFLVDKDGLVIAHRDDRLVLENTSLSTNRVVSQAIKSRVNSGQRRYQNRKDGATYIASFAKAVFGLTIISEAPESVILEPAKKVEKQVYMITGIAVSVAFFIVYVFSQTLTGPIKKLVVLSKYVAKGFFDFRACQYIRSADEVGTLAVAFDNMIIGLQERDKVKNLFGKLHGDSVAEEMLSGETSIGGSKKNVAVFFSDIRSFTKFSESRSPEEVVQMLNEYFEVMVSVIYKHGGIVDKFIGDAIMAIWGAPRSTGKDPLAATSACIEMRIELDKLNQRRIARGEEAIMIGMGLHYGEAISGTIGSEDRMEYTVIGDSVNMAARIEASTKAFGTDLLLSEDIAAMVSTDFMLEETSRVSVKGKSEPLKIYKVNGYKTAQGDQPVVTPYSAYQAESADKVKIED